MTMNFPTRSGRRTRLSIEVLEGRLTPATGDIDVSFAGNGRKLVSFNLGGTLDDHGEAITMDSSGRILFAGDVELANGNHDFAVTRLNSNGTLDTTFGGTGKVTIPFDLTANGNDRARGIAIDGTGRIVLAGFVQVSPGNYDFGVVRLNTDGSLDTTFSGDGKQTVAFNIVSGGEDKASGVAVNSRNEIILGGYAEMTSSGDFDFAAARLLPNGSLDPAFSGDGKQTIGFQRGGDNDDRAWALTLDGLKPVLAGYNNDGSGDYDFGAVRLTDAGIPDNTFDGDGKRITGFGLAGAFNDKAQAVAVDSSGRILLAGFAQAGNTDYDMAIVRYNNDGSLDNTFNGNGRRHIAFNRGGDNIDIVTGIAFDGSKIVLGGYSQDNHNANDFDFAAVRLNQNGNLDQTFAPNGSEDGSFQGGGAQFIGFGIGGSFSDRARGVLVDPQGRVVLGGEAQITDTDYDFGLIRLHGREFPTVNLGDAVITEGNSGTKNLSFTVTLSAASLLTTTIDYATSDLTANSGSDYASASGLLTFAPGETSKNIVIDILGDTLVENDETFRVTLSNPNFLIVGDGQGVGTITNDDFPTISINDITVTEGTGGTTNATFTVTMSQSSPRPVTVNFATANGTAAAGSDFTAVSGVLTFAPGDTTKSITLPVIADGAIEANETFTMVLSSPTQASVGDGQGVCTITNDDVPSFMISDVTVVEGNAGTANATFIVSLTGASSLTTSVTYATANGTALAGSDFLETTGTLVFIPGETSKSVSVSVNGDFLVEAIETFHVLLSNPVSAPIADGDGVGSITNDDTASIVVSPTNPLITTESGGTATFTVVLTSQPIADVSIVIASGKPTEGTVSPSSLIFSSVNWNVPQAVTVTGVQDNVADGDVSFTVVTNPATSTDVSYSGMNGSDVLVLNQEIGLVGTTWTIHGTPTNDSFAFFQASPRQFNLNGFTVPVSGNVTQVLFDGGAGADTVTLTGDQSNEKATLRPGSGTVIGQGYVVTLSKIESATVNLGAGRDEAVLFDSSGNDQFVGKPLLSTLKGPGYSLSVQGAERISAFATAGVDDAYLYDSTGNDVYVGKKNVSSMTSSAFVHVANAFDRYFAFASNGNDTAYLYDTAGNDTYTGKPSVSTMTGSGYSNAAAKFDKVFAYASTGNDIAYLYDSAGNDLYYGRSTYGYFSGPGYYNYAAGFDRYFAYATGGGKDTAYLYDSKGNDTFTGNPTVSTLIGPALYQYTTRFEAIYAFAANGGRDTAILRDVRKNFAREFEIVR